MVRVLIADDEAMIREAIASLLSLNKDLDIVGQAANGKQAVELAAALEPDVVLMDLQMPVLDGVQATAQIKNNNPKTAVLVLTTYADDELIVASLRNGAGGYLLKDSGSEQIASAILSIAQGYTTMGQSVAARLIANLSNNERTPLATTPLTEREIEVLSLLKEGFTNSDIAEKLNIEVKTVRDHVVNILTRLDLKNRTQAALWAKENLP